MTRPTILVSNDDGYGTQGIMALVDALQDIGDVWVVAPATEQSAVSSSLSLRTPVRLRQVAPQHFTVSGTPADSVYMGLNKVLPVRPDLCITGVNHGANLGNDVIYSGTVAAAIETTLIGVPSLAVSLASYDKDVSYDIAALAAAKIARHMCSNRLARGVLLNLNVPKDAQPETPIRVTKLGRRNYARKVSTQNDPRGGSYSWIGGDVLPADDIPGSDCNAIARGELSLTPISLDLTHYRSMTEVQQWFQE